jgi:hypothetical protein
MSQNFWRRVVTGTAIGGIWINESAQTISKNPIFHDNVLFYNDLDCQSIQGTAAPPNPNITAHSRIVDMEMEKTAKKQAILTQFKMKGPLPGKTTKIQKILFFRKQCNIINYICVFALPSLSRAW